MDWTYVEGNWHQAKGAVKEKWGRLTDNELKVIDGQRERLAGKLQELYGYTAEEVDEVLDDFLVTMK